jgi:hypothetical protein
LAARHSNIDIVQLLLNNGADITLINRYEHTALHSAAIGFDEHPLAGHGRLTEICKILLWRGADLMARDQKCNTSLDYIRNKQTKQTLSEIAEAYLYWSYRRGLVLLHTSVPKSSYMAAIKLLCNKDVMRHIVAFI